MGDHERMNTLREQEIILQKKSMTQQEENERISLQELRDAGLAKKRLKQMEEQRLKMEEEERIKAEELEQERLHAHRLKEQEIERKRLQKLEDERIEQERIRKEEEEKENDIYEANLLQRKQNEKERKVTHLEMEQLVRTASMLDDIKSIATMATQFSTESVDLCATPHEDVQADDHFDEVFDNVMAKQSQTQKNAVSKKKKSAKQIQMEEEQEKRRK